MAGKEGEHLAILRCRVEAFANRLDHAIEQRLRITQAVRAMPRNNLIATPRPDLHMPALAVPADAVRRRQPMPGGELPECCVIDLRH